MKIIYIEWCDAVNNLASWISLDDAVTWADSEHWLVKQSGFLVKETSEYILLASKINLYDPEQPELGGLVKIPTPWIRKRIFLNEEVDSK